MHIIIIIIIIIPTFLYFNVRGAMSVFFYINKNVKIIITIEYYLLIIIIWFVVVGCSTYVAILVYNVYEYIIARFNS